MAAERRLAVRSCTRAQQPLRGGATPPPAVRESSANHCCPLERADAERRRRGHHRRGVRKAPTRRRPCSTNSWKSARSCGRSPRPGFRRTATARRPRYRSTRVPSSRAWCDVAARGSSRRTQPARPPSARGSPCRSSRVVRLSAFSSSAGRSRSRSTTTITASSELSPARERRHSTEPGTSTRSARSPRPSSAASCPSRCHASPECRSPRATSRHAGPGHRRRLVRRRRAARRPARPGRG